MSLFFFFLISTQQSNQGIKSAELIDETSETLHWIRQQQKFDMDPEQQLYTPKIENIAVIDMYEDI
ncbi:hypothetical protein LAZ67_12003218 [Cordylochernes scorpioides]|uniref:Uncharacterized protein n=1 Tax=Cordylochernes scorpioides TaxID=51811 RepID=A0ABY6L4Z1_9ARAC|nr:hypothetical protein LAZ67_12003218 [Cordylochernes scorpioides]